jgi:hypothetical protein
LTALDPTLACGDRIIRRPVQHHIDDRVERARRKLFRAAMKFPAALLTRPSSGRSRQISSNMASTLSGCCKSHTIWDGVASRCLPFLHGIFENFLPASTYYYFGTQFDKAVPKLLPIPVPPPVISISGPSRHRLRTCASSQNKTRSRASAHTIDSTCNVRRFACYGNSIVFCNVRL